jgi:hypothetical protein
LENQGRRPDTLRVGVGRRGAALSWELRRGSGRQRTDSESLGPWHLAWRAHCASGPSQGVRSGVRKNFSAGALFEWSWPLDALLRSIPG